MPLNTLTGYIQNEPDVNPAFTSYWNSIANQSYANGQPLQGALWANIANGTLNGGEGVPQPAYTMPIGGGSISVGRVPMAPSEAPLPIPSIPAPNGPTATATSNATAETGPINIRIANPAGGQSQGGTFNPPNYPALPQMDLQPPPNLPGFKAPGLPAMNPASTMPQGGQGPSGGGVPFFPGQGGPNGSNAAPWNVTGGSGGGGIPQLSPMQQALHNALQGQETPGIAIGANGGKQQLVPPPPPSPLMLPPGTPIYPAEGGPPVPYGQGGMSPAATLSGRSMPPATGSLWDETPQQMQQNVKSIYGDNKSPNPYGSTPEDQQKQMIEQTQKEAGAISDRYAPLYADARLQQARAEQKAQMAHAQVDEHLQNIQMLNSRQGMDFIAGKLAERAANAQEMAMPHNAMSDILSGRIPARLAPRSTRVAALRGQYLQSLLANRDDLLSKEQIGLQAAERMADRADKELEAANRHVESVDKQKNDALKEMHDANHQFYSDLNNYRNDMSQHQRGMANVGVDQTDSYLRYRSGQMHAEANMFASQQRGDAADTKHQEHEEDLDFKRGKEQDTVDYRNKKLEAQGNKSSIEGMTPNALLKAVRDASKNGIDGRIYAAELGRRNGDLPNNMSAQRYVQISDALKNGKITDDQVRERGVDPDKLRELEDFGG